MPTNDNHAQAIGRVEGKIDTMISRLDRIDQRHDRLEESLAATNKRVSTLENWRSWLLGAAAAFAYLAKYLPTISFGK